MCFNNDYSSKHEIEKVISNICNNEYQYFLNKANVIGVGYGYKIKYGFCTSKKCIQVFVLKKVPYNKLAYKDRIPIKYKGILTDVIKTGRFAIHSFTQKIIPAIGGYVLGNEYEEFNSGTLGCLVTDSKDLFILSNNHVIAALNEAPIKSKILQPSFKYGGTLKKDIIAILSKFIPINFQSISKKQVNKEKINFVDCAIAKVINKSMVLPSIALVGIPEGIIIPKLKQTVKKVGCRTELTTGEVISIKITMEINFPGDKVALFKDLIMTTKMIEHGDSGSVLLDSNNYIIGLTMAGTDNISLFNPINVVLQQLNVRLVTENLWNTLNINKDDGN